jgi:hypothetical protein
MDFKFEIPEKIRMRDRDEFWVRDEEIEKLRQQVQKQLDAGAPEAYGCLEFKVQIRVAGYNARPAGSEEWEGKTYPYEAREAIPARVVDFEGKQGALFVSPPPTIRIGRSGTEAFTGEKS